MFTPTFIVDTTGPAARATDQPQLGCHIHALSVLGQAVARGDEWIRVVKPGHHCDFSVAALRAHVATHPDLVPRGVVTADRFTHEWYGATFDHWTRNWPGAHLQRRGHGG